MEPNWAIESIPDEDVVYLRVHENHFRDGTFVYLVFQNRGSGMSVEWCKYATPEEARQCARDPTKNGIVALAVGGVRAIPTQRVEHVPTHNRAHAEVRGEKDEEVRLKLSRLARWVIPL